MWKNIICFRHVPLFWSSLSRIHFKKCSFDSKSEQMQKEISCLCWEIISLIHWLAFWWTKESFKKIICVFWAPFGSTAFLDLGFLMRVGEWKISLNKKSESLTYTVTSLLTWQQLAITFWSEAWGWIWRVRANHSPSLKTPLSLAQHLKLISPFFQSQRFNIIYSWKYLY